MLSVGWWLVGCFQLTNGNLLVLCTLLTWFTGWLVDFANCFPAVGY